MTDITFPITDEDITRENLRKWAKGLCGAADYVKSGFTCTDASSGGVAKINIAAGEAFGDGTRISRDAATNGVVLTNSATNHVFVKVDEATRNTVVIEVNTTGTAPTVPYVKIAEVVTGVGTVTTITDKRNTVAISGWSEP